MKVGGGGFIGSSPSPWIESRRGFMSRACVALAVLWTASQLVAAQGPPGHTFDDARPGTLPSGFELAAMRQDAPGRWLVRREGMNGVLHHQADESATGFALALAPDTPLRDVQASVRLRLVGGSRVAGLVWRYTDAAHYYGALLDLNNARITLFRVTDGNRTFLESEDGLELDSSAWHTLKIVHAEARIDVSLGGIRVFEERDRRYDRATGPGRTGVIASGMADVWFDDLRIGADQNRRDKR
jgi:hypothetical protein